MCRIQTLLALAGVTGALGIGCGGATGKPLHVFPSRAEIAELAAQPQAKQPIAAEMIAPEEWALALPPPVADPPGHALLATLTPGAKPSPALDCVAHELARLLLQFGDKLPSLSLQRFVAARCGAVVAVAPFRSWSAEVPPEQSDAAIIEGLRGRLNAKIAVGAREAGLGLARDGKRAVVVVTYANPEVELEPFERVVGQDGVLRIRGRVLLETDALQAFVNRGAYGSAPCELDPAVTPPAFSLACELAPGDDHAWVQMLALPRGRVMGHEVLGVLALRASDAETSYRTRHFGEPRPVDDADAFHAAVLEMVNAIRAEAGLTKLASASKQTSTANAVAPMFFNAALSPDPAAQRTLDALSLGLLAGWDVQGGIIRDGDLTASVVIDSHDAERWLSDALERPLGRAVLLSPEARVLALGSVLQGEPSVLASVALTYAFFEPEAKAGERAMRVLDRLARVRNARGLGRTVLVRDTPGVQDELARIQRGEATPGEALRGLLDTVSQSTGRAVHGFVWETSDLDAIEFPPALLTRGTLVLGAGVTHYRASGGAWGQYTVLFVVMQGVEV